MRVKCAVEVTMMSLHGNVFLEAEVCIPIYLDTIVMLDLRTVSMIF